MDACNQTMPTYETTILRAEHAMPIRIGVHIERREKNACMNTASSDAKTSPEAKKAQAMAENTFEKNTPDKRLNSFTLKRKNFSNNKISIVDAMIKLNFINSRGEAKRLIKGGGVKINDSTVINVNTLIELIHFEKKDIASIACGKKKFGLIKLIN